MGKRNPNKAEAEITVRLLLKYWGRITEIVATLIKVIGELGGDFDRCLLYLASVNGEGTIRKIGELIVAEMPATQKTRIAAKQIVSSYLVGVYDVIIDPSKNLAQMIAAGRYDWPNPNIIADHFPFNGAGKRKIKVELLHFNRDFSNGDQIIAKLKEVNDWLAKQGANYRYLFAQIEELLALGAAHPELQRLYPIAALGSIWRRAGYRFFACLSGDGARRALSLDCLGGGFSGVWRFAVVREPARR
ncbi:MAG: hypothetical protein WC668_00310 [Patescibacteria group bacterium]|jgi:hypothetical protein